MKIVIAGYGVEGRSNLAYFQRKFPAAEFVITDERAVTDAPKGVVVESGKDVFTRLGDADLVVRTASLPPRSIATDGKIWSATNEFFAKCPAPIIGVTGTKGKGTTCSLIASILRAAGKTVHLVGNIGVPALDVLPKISPDDFVVYELSSFQLWDLEKSPHIAVVLMIEPDHLDVHTDFAEYLAAKANIAAHQTADDTVIYNQNNQFSRQLATVSPAQKVAYPAELTETMKQSVKLPGAHNLDNASAAVLVVRAVLPEVSDEIICRGLADFTGLPHRLKFVAEKNGVKFYDDSISTTPGSAIAAMKAFESPKVMILGGHDKGANYTELASELVKSTSLRGVVLVGSNAELIATILQQAGLTEDKIINKGMIPMAEVVKTAVTIAKPGDVVILSPAAASFDQYKSYSDRGEQFVTATSALD